MQQQIPVAYISGVCIPNPQGHVAGYGVWWGSDSQLNLSRRIQTRQTHQQAEVEAVLATIQQAKNLQYPTIVIVTAISSSLGGADL